MAAMPGRSLLLVLLPAAAWGANFVVVKIGSQFFSALGLTSLRFLLIGLAVFYFGWPKLALRIVLLYALVSALGQYTLSTLAIYLGLSAGLASLVMQSQVFFGVLLAFFALREVPRLGTIVGVLLGFGGLAVLTFSHGQAASVPGIAVCLLAALAWACASLLLKRIGWSDVFPLQCAACLIAFPVVSALSLWLDPKPFDFAAIARQPFTAVGVVLYTTLVALFAAQSLWGWLLLRFPMNLVTPFALLIPVFGLTFAWLALGETLSPAAWLAVALVLTGLVVHFRTLFGPAERARR
jgi:O-acetylserine/cysteine efflux transporter